MSAKVYFTKDQSKIVKLFDVVSANIAGQRIALKTHFGEKGNVTFLDPQLVKVVYDQIKELGKDVNLIESNVLYQGQRMKAESHKKLAQDHGFDFGPIDIYDDKSPDDNWLIETNKLKHFDKFYLIKNLAGYDFLVVVSHFKGHMATGFGGAMKNLGMGLACRRGKLAIHASTFPEIDPELCIACGACVKDCPAGAISLDGKAKINQNFCIGCAHCVAVCPQGAVQVFSATTDQLQERIVEYAYAATRNIPAVYFNFLVNITAHCDCHGEPDKVLIPHIGFLASTDPVAIDQASFDLVEKVGGKDFFAKVNNVSGLTQLEYAEQIGLGSRQYELIEI